MLTKFETRSNRVKGLCFHPKRPWILASLHNGAVQLWDYRMAAMLDKYQEHEGPVRGVDFHSTQPLFVTGGDDYKIKVWNYKLRRCLYTLTGHLDYIRTVQFHKEQPWIISSSDDQTIRIWNWQSRTCISVLTGHNHYVMSAFFHPREDLVVSASLDQSVRVWDISGLKKKNPSSLPEELLRVAAINQELFGSSDVNVKYILEGHDLGVNWAAFHPTLPLVISASDDRQVKLWRMNEARAWEVDTLRGHISNVSCAAFLPKQEMIISNSEDKSIRVWDLNRRTPIHTFRRENERFWVLAVHPELNLIAAGHDGGLMVFKLERERPASITSRDTVLYVKDNYLRKYDLKSNTDSSVVQIRRPNITAAAPKTISYNAAENCVLITSSTEGGSFEMFSLDGNNTDCKGLGINAVFVARNKFAVLDKYKQIIIKNLKNEVLKKFTPSTAPVENIFQAATGTMLLCCDDKVHLLDLQQKKVLCDMNVTNVKYVVWSEDMSRVAFISKHVVTIATKKLEHLSTVHETMRIKSGVFDENGVFIYATLNHLKYCLPNGDNGIVKSIDSVIYLVSVKGTALHYLDRDGRVNLTYIDATEYKFKMALMKRKLDEIFKIVASHKLQGQATIAFLQQKGYPDIAMKFVKDDLTKFNLALECGHLAVAQECAQKLNKKECWARLGAEALTQGDQETVELCYQRTKDFEKLSFLYLITGNPKLSKMIKYSEMRNDVMGRFQNALYVGDVEERIKVLQSVGQVNLAYATAVTHGLTEIAEGLKQQLESSGATVPEIDTTKRTQLLMPPVPILRQGDWPLLNVAPAMVDTVFTNDGELNTDILGANEELGSGGDWDMGLDLDEVTQKGNDLNPEEGDGEGWAGIDELDVELDKIKLDKPVAQTGGFVIPPKGKSIQEFWLQNSQLAADRIAAGSFDTAMQLLHKNVGIVNFAPLKEFFMNIYMGANASLPISPLQPSINIPLQRNWKETGADKRNLSLPIQPYALPALTEKLNAAYKAMTNGKFTEAKALFMSIMHSILFVVVDSKQEAAELKELLGICREYVSAINLELRKKEMKDANPVNQAELAAYFTHYNIQPIHLMLSLGSAMTAAYKIKNYLTAASFANRLLSLNPNQRMAAQAQKLVQLAAQNPQNEHKLNYDEHNPFVVCNLSMTPVYRGSDQLSLVRCAYCYAPYQQTHRLKLCAVCEVAQIGVDTPGLVSSLK